jgi:hypothetical protein
MKQREGECGSQVKCCLLSPLLEINASVLLVETRLTVRSDWLQFSKALPLLFHRIKCTGSYMGVMSWLTEYYAVNR